MQQQGDSPQVEKSRRRRLNNHEEGMGLPDVEKEEAYVYPDYPDHGRPEDKNWVEKVAIALLVVSILAISFYVISALANGIFNIMVFIGIVGGSLSVLAGVFAVATLIDRLNSIISLLNDIKTGKAEK